MKKYLKHANSRLYLEIPVMVGVELGRESPQWGHDKDSSRGTLGRPFWLLDGYMRPLSSHLILGSKPF